ncbi:MAG: alanine racemase [Acidobacteria bacterium]|nr:alanine racemase [Acidobacteriota bacterium]
MRTFVRIDLSRIAQNYRNLRAACLPGGDVLAVVKANAYGHGAVAVAGALEAIGCRRFAVASPGEGVELRQAGVGGEIVVLEGFLPGEDDVFVAERLTPLLHHPGQVERWVELGGAASTPLPCYLKVNTGMNRLGVELDRAQSIASRLACARGVEFLGLATHLASAEDFEDPAADEQMERFEELLGAMEAASVPLPSVHFANSAALAYRPTGAGNVARCGLALYGWLPPTAGPAGAPRAEVRPALEWRARVLSVRELGIGDRVGYSGIFRAERPMRIAALGVGYGDGYRRELSEGGRVLLGEASCPVVGRVSMDITTVDVSQCGIVEPGDEAILLSPELSAHEVAARCGTIAYEILCGISGRVPRIYEQRG